MVLCINHKCNCNGNAAPITQSSICLEISSLPFSFLPSIAKFLLFNPAEGEKRDKIDKPLVEWPRGDDAPSVLCRGLNFFHERLKESNAGTCFALWIGACYPCFLL